MAQTTNFKPITEGLGVKIGLGARKLGVLPYVKEVILSTF